MRRRTAWATLALGVLFLALPVAAGSQARRRPEAPIRLRAATFVPSRGEPRVPPGLRARSLAEGERGIYLVQFVGPVEPTWKDDVAATGGELLEYMPDFAFKVRMDGRVAARVRALPSVRWVGRFHPAYKLSPRLTRDGQRLYTVRLERGSDGTRAEAALQALGSQVVGRQGRTVVLSAEGSRLEALARLDSVAWIEDFALRRRHNEYGGGTIMGSSVANGAGYDGSSQIVALADTGLGGGTPETAHMGIPAGRVSAIYNWPGAPDACFETVVNDGAVDVDTGHGTHTAASAVSQGDGAGKGRGTAPGASLVFQAVENYATVTFLCELYGYTDGYYLTGIPVDIRQLFLQAYDAGARVHSDSWGSPAASAYTVDSANADDFVWNHRDLLIAFSAGNAGTDANADGGVDGWSLDSPATAKNVLAVGASENDRASDYECDAGVYAVCAAQGGQNQLFTYGQSWPFDFPAEPLKSDPSAGNAEQMAAFSSRGPSGDGRIKPDVVAPGTWVLSAYSDLYQEGYDPAANPQNGLYQYDGWGFPSGDVHKYMGGTSMAAPLAAGGAAVVRDFYQKLFSHSASAALVKGTIINSAVDLLDENNDGVNDNAIPIPNFYEGWGRVDLAAATDGSQLFVDEGTGLVTGASQSFPYDVAAGTPFKVTLAWTDFPSTEAAGKNLVNDLDLEVSGPGGEFFRGNVFGLGWSIEGGLRDNTNNLENVFVQAPAAGTWTVTVRGYNVPQSPQPFALVVTGQVSEVGPSHTLTVSVPGQGTITSTDGFITCGTGGSDCSHAYDPGASVDLIAAADPGYSFVVWTGDCTGTSCSVTMDQDRTVGATFAVIPVTVSIDDPIALEGGCGTSDLVFQVSLGAASPEVVTVTYATEDGSALAGEDYAADSDVLTFNPGIQTQPVVISISGDTAFEPDELFGVRLSAPANATLSDDLGQGTITNDDPDPATGTESVVWTHAVGVSVCGRDITKTAAEGWGNAGASSTRAIDGDGHAEFTVPADPGYAMFGLASSDPSQGYADLDFAFYTYPPSGQLMIYEGGVYRGMFGPYAEGQKLRITVASGAVSYWRDGLEIHASAVTPSLPLRVDTSLYSTGALVKDAVLAGALIDLVPASTEPVTWTDAMGVSIAANTIMKTAPAGWANAGATSTRGVNGDGYVEYTVPTAPGYAMFGLTHNDSGYGYSEIDFAFYTYPTSGQLMIFENGAYRGTFGAYAEGQKLQIMVASGVVSYWRDGLQLYVSTASPTLPLRADTSLYSTGAMVKDAAFGGTLVDIPASPTEPVVWTNVVGVLPAASTITKTAPTGWGNAGAASTRAIDDQGHATFTIPAAPGYAAFGLSHGDSDQDYPDIDYAFYTYPPTTELMILENGVYQGTVGTYAAGDTLRISVAAGVVRYWHNGGLVYTSRWRPTFPLRVDTSLYSTNAEVQGVTLTGNLVDAVPLQSTESVAWQNLVGVSSLGPTLTKTAPIGWGNAGASSTKGIDGEGYAEFTVPLSPGYAMFGLGNGDTDQNYPDIDYAFYTYPPTAQLMIFENGTFRGIFGTYSSGQKLRITVESGVVKYSKDGTLLFTSSQAPTLSLRVDTSLYSTGASVEEATLAGVLVTE